MADKRLLCEEFNMITNELLEERVLSEEATKALGECMAAYILEHPGADNFLQRISESKLEPHQQEAIAKIIALFESERV